MSIKLLKNTAGVELMKTSTCYAVFFDIDSTGDGIADDREVSTFDDEESAREFFNQILMQ